jgi:hypothetical protein
MPAHRVAAAARPVPGWRLGMCLGVLVLVLAAAEPLLRGCSRLVWAATFLQPSGQPCHNPGPGF